MPVNGTVGVVTVNVHVELLFPSTEATVITVVPAVLAVTNPEELTVAMFVLPDDQVTAWLVALLGATVTVSVSVAPTFSESDVLFNDTPVTEITGFVTVIAQVAFLLPSVVVTVIVAVPAVFADTRPVTLTVAMFVLLDDQVTALLVASYGRTIAYN
jgi:hypothetical protein